MKYKLLITKDAHNDIEEIVNYISNVLHNPVAAGKLLMEIEEVYKILSDNPESFEYCRDKRLRDGGYRKIPVKNYIIFYKIEQDVVYIMRVIYGRRNYTNII